MTTLLLLAVGLAAGVFGALLGLGGGFLVIPVLTILFHMPIHSAIGISLIAVIATSTSAAVVYVREGRVDIRLGMLLELGTTVGAIVGAIIAAFVSSRVLYLLFSLLLLYNAYAMYRKDEPARGQIAAAGGPEPAAGGVKPVLKGVDTPEYEVKNLPLGLAFSGIAGILSGLLGIGGGLIKIPVMYTLMGVPLKTAVATSNFMIGVTAAASASIYYLSGNVSPVETVPVALGVFVGANMGLRFNKAFSVRTLKRLFIIVFLYVALQMIIKGIGS